MYTILKNQILKGSFTLSKFVSKGESKMAIGSGLGQQIFHLNRRTRETGPENKVTVHQTRDKGLWKRQTRVKKGRQRRPRFIAGIGGKKKKKRPYWDWPNKFQPSGGGKATKSGRGFARSLQ